MSATYQAQEMGGEAIFTWLGDLIVGSVHLQGDSWLLQGCGDKCYLWIKHINDWADSDGTIIPANPLRNSPVSPISDDDWEERIV